MLLTLRSIAIIGTDEKITDAVETHSSSPYEMPLIYYHISMAYEKEASLDLLGHF